MSRPRNAIPLTPLGTARERIGAPVAAWPFPDDLRGAARDNDLGDESLYLSWELARLAEGLEDGERRALLLLALASILSLRQGSTRMPLAGGPGDHLRETLSVLGASAADLAAVNTLIAALREGAGKARPIIGAPGDQVPLIVETGPQGMHLYQHRMLARESSLARLLAARRASKLDGVGAADLPRAPEGPGIELSPAQQAAVRSALRSPLTVISGGPGTGKTFIIVSIVRALGRLGLPFESIALAAPTGKAANRMEQALRERLPEAAAVHPQTLHRLLGYLPSTGGFKHHHNNRLAHRVVIVDECSMVDLVLMERLVRSVRDDARLVLLGDPDQLPSVDAGAVFRDLGGLAARLDRTFRVDTGGPSGRGILELAERVSEGDARGAEASLRFRPSAGELAFEGVEMLPAAQRGALLDRWWTERIRGLPDFERLTRKVYQRRENAFVGRDAADAAALLRHLESNRVLCLTRSDARPTGAETVNELLHQRMLDGGHAPFCPGEPILMLHNDYDRGLYNGDQGVVLLVADADGRDRARPMAVFPRSGGFGVFPLDGLRGEITLCFAMTVHKSQGSEFEHVALVLPEADIALLTREVVYTAITRCRRSVVIVGDPDLLRRGIERRMQRFSGIAEKLAGSV